MINKIFFLAIMVLYSELMLNAFDNQFATSNTDEAAKIAAQKDSIRSFSPSNMQNKVSALPIAKELRRPTGIVFDVTKDPTTNDLSISKIITEVAKITVPIDKIISEFPREVMVDTCSGTGCPIESVQCDAVYENPLCPNGELNTTTHMCESNPLTTLCPGNHSAPNTNRNIRFAL